MAHQGLILLKRPGQLVPDAFLEHILPKYVSGVGVAIPDGQTVAMDTVAKTVTVPAFKEMQETFKDSLAVFYFASFSEGFLPDDIQPFSLIKNEAGKTVVVGFLAIDDRCHEDSSKHSDEFMFASKLLTPKLQQLWRLTGGDMTKFLEEVRHTPSGELISGKTGGEYILLLTASKETVTMYDTKNRGEFPWGIVSNTHGYSETTTEKTEDKPQGLFSKLANQKFAASPLPDTKLEPTGKPVLKQTGTTISEQRILETVKKPDDPKSSTSIPTTVALEPDAGALIFPPNSIGQGRQHKNALKKWYRGNFTGELPKNYLERPGMPRDLLRHDAPILRDLKSLGTVVEPVTPADPGSGPQPDVVEPVKKVETPVIPAEEHGPIIIPKQALSDLDAMFKKIGAEPIMRPDQIQSLEAPKPTFSTQTGLAGLETTFAWSEDRWKQMADLDRKHGSYMMVLALMQYRHAYLTELATQPAKGEKDTTTKHIQAPSTPAKNNPTGSIFGNLKRSA